MSLKDVIAEAVTHLKSDFARQPALEARLRMEVALVHLSAREPDLAAIQLDQVEAILTINDTIEPKDRTRFILCKALHHMLLDEYTEAGRLARQVLNQWPFSNSGDTLEDIAVRGNIATILASNQAYPQALELRSENWRVCQQRFGPTHNATLFWKLQKGLAILNLPGRANEAKEIFEQVIEQGSRSQPIELSSYEAHLALGRFLLARKEYNAALNHLRFASEYLESVSGPGDLIAYNAKTDTILAMATKTNAAEHCRRLKDHWISGQQALGKEEPFVIYVQEKYAQALLTCQSYDLANQILIETTTHLGAKYGSNSIEVAQQWMEIGLMYREVKLWDESIDAYKHSAHIWHRHDGRQQATWMVEYDLGVVLWLAQRYTEAEKVFEILTQERGERLGDFHSDTLLSSMMLARSIFDQGRKTEAEALLKDLLDRCPASEYEANRGYQEARIFYDYFISQHTK